MHCEELFETSLTVQTPCSIPDYDEYCMKELRNRYEGKCFRGKFVEMITNIIDRSSPVFNSAPLGTANITVKFKAKTISYPPGTILTNCVVSRVDPTHRITLKKDNVRIFINRDKHLLNLKKGHIISVEVGDARYGINSRLVGVRALPYIFPKPDENFYQINPGEITEEEMNKLNSNMIERNNKIPDKLWNMFYTMYYPYRVEQKTPKGTKKVNMLKLPRKPIYVQRPPEINEADPDVYVFESSPPEGSTVIPESAFIILDMFVKRYRDHVKLLEEMCTKFNKEKSRKDNRAVWLIHDKLKKGNKKTAIEGGSDDFSRILDDAMPLLKYKPGRAKELHEKVMAWGQKKLLLSEIEFMTLYGNMSKTVVYAGSAPGTHITILSDLFPKHKFILYDPRKFAKRLEKYSRIETHEDYFTNEVAEKFKDQKVLFISDIRRGNIDDPEFEKIIIEDMEIQKKWINIMEPILSMLKFRLPYTPGKTKYFYGDIYLQAYAPLTSTETRLITDGKSIVEYDHTKYEEQMHYFNMKIRTEGYDNKCEKYIYKQYVNSEYNKLFSEDEQFTVNSLKNKINKLLCKNYIQQNSSQFEHPRYKKIYEYCQKQQRKHNWKF